MSKERNDMTLKVFALIIAVILWSYVMSEVNPEQKDNIKNVSVAFNNLEALERQGLILMEPKEATVNVRIKGNKTDMDKFSSKSIKPIKAQVDLSGYSEGQVKVPVNVFIDQFSNITIEKVEPSEILFTFDKLTSKDKTVTIKSTGKLEEGYVVGDISTKSQSILLKGPRSWVNEVAEIVAIVNLNGRKENASLTIPILLLDDQGNEVRGLTYEPSVIDVTVPIFRTVTLPIELQTEKELPENYEITDIAIKPNYITLKGDNNIINLTSIQTKPVDINLFIENPVLEVELDLPDNVSLLNPNERVTVSLNIDETNSKLIEYTLGDIDIRNLDSELIIAQEDLAKTIQILVKGNKEVIEELTKEDLQVYLDLNLLREGTHQVYIGINVLEGVTVKEISPKSVELKLIAR